MTLSIKMAKILSDLLAGDSIPSSTARGKLIEDLVSENILFRKGRHRKILILKDEQALYNYLANQLQIDDLNAYIFTLENEKASRADLVKVATDSKLSKRRTFQGFLVNTYDAITTQLDGEKFIVYPRQGSFTFIYDYERFEIPKDIIVVGMENPENFRYIQKQRHLFKNMMPLFVSRYPQSQHKDFIRWMKAIPNKYLHFGDFDLAGIGIYLHEYKKHLTQKASFFVPEGIEVAIRDKGSRERYNKQKANFDISTIVEPKLLDLIRTIHLEKKGLDQEYYIKTDH